MAARDDPTLLDLFRERPVQTLLLSVSPILLGAVQLANGYVNEFPMLVAVGFAVVMGLFSVSVTQYHLAAFRLATLERSIPQPMAD